MMQSQSAQALTKLPVFVFPQGITFFLDEQSSHKQVLTLYNPYDFPVKFKVLCTAPNKYKVVDPEGSIKPTCCVDIVIRHMALSLANCNVTDKFRIQMQEHATKQGIGRKDVEAKLLPGTRDMYGRSTPDPEMFQQLPLHEKKHQESYALVAENKTVDKTTCKIYTQSPKSKYNLFQEDDQDKNTKIFLSSNTKKANYIIMDKGGTNYVALVAGIICIVGLLLPTEGEHSHRVPEYLHLSINIKLIFSFVLGMVAMIVLRP